MKNLSMKQCLNKFKKDLLILDYDFENNSITQIISQWWYSQFGVSNIQRQQELEQMYLN